MSHFTPWAIGVLSIAILYCAREVLIPLASATLLTFLLAPAIGWMERRRLPRIPAVFIVLLFAMTSIVAITWVTSSQLLDVINRLPGYKENIQRKVDVIHGQQGGILTKTAASVEELTKELTTTPPNQAVPVAEDPGNISKAVPSAASGLHPIPVEVISPQRSALQSARDVVGPLFGVLGSFVMVVVFSIFMLMKREDLRNRLIRLVAKDHLNVVTQAMDDAGRRVSRYLLMQFLVNTAFGGAIAAGLFSIGVPNALLWGALGATLRFFPYVGPLIAGTLPLLLALAVFSDWMHPLLTFGLFLAIELITANVVEPRLYGAQTGISSLAILVAAVFWTVLWGPVGLVLSTPLTVCLVVLGRYVPQLEFLHILLGDEPVLTPDARFYQRLLAMDQKEAQTVSETFVKERSLIDLYDEVVIPALAMAEQDRHQGRLRPTNEAFIIQSVNELVVQLADQKPEPVADGNHPSVDESPRARVVCLAANDQADELTASMLAQIVEHAGYAAITLQASESIMETCELLLGHPDDIVCVCALPPFALFHARTLSKKLRLRFPELRIIVGIWTISETSVRVKERLGNAFVDTVVTNLKQAVDELNELTGTVSVDQPRDLAEPFATQLL